MKLILASASPARLATLNNAGLSPIVRVSHVDEEAIEQNLPNASPKELAQALAQKRTPDPARDPRPFLNMGPWPHGAHEPMGSTGPAQALVMGLGPEG